MRAEVVGLKGAIIANNRRRMFMDEVGAAFDLYVNHFGCEPESLVHVLGGVKQSARVGWLFTGESEGAGVSMLALSAALLTKEIVNPD
jgi:hypothetical protein